MSASVPKLTPSGLAALMCARICHDLVSPIGALGTAIEVMNDEKNVDMHDDALALIKTSAAQASAKLQYLRIAFGAAGSAPGIISMDELKTHVHGMYGDHKADTVWDTDLTGLEKSRARLLLNLIMLAFQAVPRGGAVKISIRSTDESDHITLVSEGLKARLDASVTHTLAGKAPEDGFDGRSIQPFYAGMIVRELKGQVSAAIDGEQVTFNAILPISEPSEAA